MASGISFGHFNIVGRDVREDGPYVAVLEDRTPAESVADLYVVLEPASPGSNQLCPELMRLIESQFGHPQYSLTGNILQSIRAAQEHLRAWNKSCPPGQRAAVGATCLAVCGDQAYLAHTGPGVSYIRHAGHLRRAEAIEPEAKAPMGTSLVCSPSFSRLELSQGDTLLLVSSRFAELVDDGTTDLILSLPPGEALPEIYKLARNEIEFSALYLAITGALSSQTRHEPNAGAQGRGDPNGRRNSPDSTRTMPAENNLLSARRRDLERLTDRHSLTVPRPALYTIAALLALSLAGWFGMPRLLQTGRQDRIVSLINDAHRQTQAAAATRDPAQKRKFLEKAQADTLEARDLRPADPQVTAIDADVRKAIDDLNQVRSLRSVTAIADLSNSPVAARAVTDLVATSRLYLLDGSTGKVYAFGLGAQQTAPALVFEQGKLVESIQTGKAAHLAVRPASGSRPATLYVLDANRRLFSLDDAGTLRAVGLASAGAWKSATALAFNANELYVLDSGGNQIWQYGATDAGFTADPTPLLTKADLQDASQLAALDEVYVTTLNGKMLRVSKGRIAEVKLSGIDHPLVSPQPPVSDASNRLRYIADPGNQRIVAADDHDVYSHQFTGVALHGLRTIALDPNSGVLYALSEQKLISASVR